MNTCQDCKFYQPETEYQGGYPVGFYKWGRCFANPPVFNAAARSWIYPVVEEGTRSCRFFQREEIAGEKVK